MCKTFAANIRYNILKLPLWQGGSSAVRAVVEVGVIEMFDKLNEMTKWPEVAVSRKCNNT